MKRVLFVDDDPSVLDGLRTRLRALRSKWEMVFVESGTRAIVEFELHTVDVIVSDMRMPGMSGAELLAIVRDRWPATIRIVLSGYADEQSARLLPIAHQFVDKPCDAHHIENVIERCLQLHELLTEPRLRAVLGCIRSLPAMPRTYARLQAAMAKEEACVAEIASIVQDDPAIAAKVLQAVNSAFFRLARTITRIDQAVSYLGFNTLRAVVMSVEVACMWKLKRSCSAIDPELLQEHAKRVAAAARALCTEPSMADEALLAGLLHNIGYWVLLQECPDDLSRALRLAQSQAIPLHEAEREIIGASNAQLGAYLLGLWGLPYSVIEAVAFRHAAGRIRQSRFDVLAALVTADGLVPQSDPAFARLSAPVETAAGQAYLNSLHAPFDWAEAQRRVLDTIGDPQS